MIAAGPWDESSLRDIRDDSIDRQIGHYIDRDDMVATVMSTFVSATVHCARCHDHKFDPITQEDYYSLQAVFAGADKAERPYDLDPALARERRSLSAELGAVQGKTRAVRLAGGRAGSPAAPRNWSSRRRATSPRTPATSRRAARGRSMSSVGATSTSPGSRRRPGTLGCVADLSARFALTARRRRVGAARRWPAG